MSSEAKTTLFDWVASEVKFPDGYVSNLSRCVERGQKFSGMKSHDCHVFMQRLLPFAFAELLPANVHEALAGNYNFIIYIHMLRNVINLITFAIYSHRRIFQRS